jgi:hypothetical protein
MTRRTRSTLAILVALSFASGAVADALLVDLDATQNNLDAPVEVFLDAGTYKVTPVGIADGGAYDAWQPWGDFTTCETPSGCAQTVPTTETGWKNAYDVISDALTAVSVDEVELVPEASEPTGDGLIHDHWIASPSEPDRYHVDDAIVYPTAEDVIATGKSSVFTVSDAGFVGFSIRDGVPEDNLGGLSLEITPVPEPPATPALVAGFGSIVLLERRRRAA